MSANSIESILIVGGGAAGWLTASILAARHGKNIRISLLESAEVKTVGVGEGTWPSMKSTLQEIGVSEVDFFRECDASFKQGVKFIDWTHGNGDSFYHPFSLPTGFLEKNLATYWLKHKNGQAFADAVCAQASLCELNLAPKTIDRPEYKSQFNYGYHLDAGKFTAFLTKHATQTLAVKHILATLNTVELTPDGSIGSVSTVDGQTLTADLFIDCSGFSSLLLGKALGVQFIDKSATLFIDKALALQLPYENKDAPILPYTISAAQAAGWIWDIGLAGRRGVGHVYSSRHMSEEQALKTLANYVGPAFSEVAIKRLDIPCGHREVFWTKNCVAIGMAAGFIEPLEASALVMVELAANFVRDQLPECTSIMPIIAKRFNQLQTYRWDRIVDFLKLHYLLSKREDSAFWRDNRAPSSIPESLQELLALWRYHAPYRRDFPHKEEVFPAASYQFILYGMEFDTRVSSRSSPEDDEFFAKRIEDNHKLKLALRSILPDTRALLGHIKAVGMG